MITITRIYFFSLHNSQPYLGVLSIVIILLRLIAQVGRSLILLQLVNKSARKMSADIVEYDFKNKAVIVTG